MNKLSRILVVNDEKNGLEIALTKAATVEHFTGAEVEVAEVIWDHVEEEAIPSSHKTKVIEALLATEQRELQKLLDQFKDRIAWGDAQVLWDKRSLDVILREISQRQIDLLIKPAKPHAFGHFIHAPLDWQLIRNAPCPVLMSKSDHWEQGGVVLAAVDVADEVHNDLTDKVLNVAQQMSAILGATLHVVCVYSDLGQTIGDYQVAMDYAGIKADMRQARADTLAQTLQRLGIEQAETHFLEGKAHKRIAGLAQELAANVTVIGTSARSGLSRLMLGNTSENTLALIQGDVLTVRT